MIYIDHGALVLEKHGQECVRRGSNYSLGGRWLEQGPILRCCMVS